MLLVSHPPFALVYNSEDIATEIVRTLAGSLGIVAAVPLTTFIATTLVGRAAGVGAGEPSAARSNRWSWPVAGMAVAVLRPARARPPSCRRPSRVARPLATEPPFAAPPGTDFGPEATAPSNDVFPTDAVDASPADNPSANPDQGEPVLAGFGEPVPVNIGTATVGTASVERATVKGQALHTVRASVSYAAIGTWPLDPNAWEILTANGTEIPLAAAPPVSGTLAAGDTRTFAISAQTSKNLRNAFIAYRDTPDTFTFLVALP